MSRVFRMATHPFSIEQVPWLAYSPDLNNIEHVWSPIKKSYSAQTVSFHSIGKIIEDMRSKISLNHIQVQIISRLLFKILIGLFLEYFACSQFLHYLTSFQTKCFVLTFSGVLELYFIQRVVTQYIEEVSSAYNNIFLFFLFFCQKWVGFHLSLSIDK